MKGMEGGERVEIELTPNDPRHAWRPEEPPPTERPLEQPAAPTRPDRTNEPSRLRRRMMIVVVGVVAFGAGWVLGRADDPNGTDAVPATTGQSVSTSPTIAGDLVPAVESVPPATSGPRPTTTSVAPTETTVIDVDPRLAEAAYELVGLGRTGELVSLDLTDGALVIRHDLGTTAIGGPAAIWAGEGWVVVPDWNTDSALLIEGDGGAVRLTTGPPWQIFESDTPGEFWILDQSLRTGAPGDAHRVDRFGEPIGEPVSLEEIPLYSDPTGGLVVQATGTAYRVDGDQISRIADGNLLALGEQRAVARTCDEQLRCSYVVVDRATGLSTPLPIDSAIRYLPRYWASMDTTQIAPDGHTIAVTWTDPASREMLGLIDIDTGETTTLSGASDGILRWTPDARFALYLEAGLPMAHDIAAGESFVIADDMPRLNALAVRPRSAG